MAVTLTLVLHQFLQAEYKAMAVAKLREEHVEKDEEGVYIVRCACWEGACCCEGMWASQPGGHYHCPLY